MLFWFEKRVAPIRVLIIFVPMRNPNQKGETVKIGYARVSTQEQHLDLQLDALHQAAAKNLPGATGDHTEGF